ncbi:streptomycin 6-kinase [Rhodococcus sp. SMB37]|nr:streptomycin 6-kinase [Rhodococcus sp. SMB37]
MVRKLCVALLLCWSTRRRGAGPTARRACGVESVCLPCVTVDRTDTGLGCDHRLVPLIPTPSTVDLENAAARLGFKLAGTPFRTQTSLLCPVTFEGQRGFVKVTNDPEELTGARALEKWAGNGAVRVLARQGNAVVLEYAGLPVRSVIPDDTAATTVLCAVAERLHSHTPEGFDGFPTLQRWFSSLFADTDSRFDHIREIADRLLGRSDRPVLLHGDLHHDNVLYTPRRGWLAIDPKGLAGPREFDYCNIFTNPTPHVAVGRFDSRVKAIADTAGIDPVDLLRWIACWGALSGIWHLEDGEVARASLPHAIAALAMERLGQCRMTS